MKGDFMRKSSKMMLHACFSRTGSHARGSVLLMVIIVSAILFSSLIFVLVNMNEAQRAHATRMEADRAYYVAEAGLAQALAWLQAQSTPPTESTILESASDLFTVPAGCESAYTLKVSIIYQSLPVSINNPNGVENWTIVSTASYQGGRGPSARSFSRRVQATFWPENFARFEEFVDYSRIWAQGGVDPYFGLGKVFFGPVHSNSGVGFFPNLWFLDTFSTAASGNPPVRTYNQWSTFLRGVYGLSSAYNYINILQHYNDLYRYEPKFYKGIEQTPSAVTLPEIRVDQNAERLRNTAGLRLPLYFPDYDSSKGPHFVIELADPSPADGDGVVKVRQFVGYDNSTNPPTPLFNPPASADPIVYPMSAINYALVVEGNVTSLHGVVDGPLSIGAFSATAGDGLGNINIDGDISYESRIANTSFRYSDDANLYVDGPDENGDGYPDTRDINQTTVGLLRTQVDNLNDILGLVSDGNVVIKDANLYGNPVIPSATTPFHVDAIVMATGKSTPGNSHDGYYMVEKYRTRAARNAYILGGSIQQERGDWANYTSGRLVAGLGRTSLFDFRATYPSGAPPYFPTTGNYVYLENSWRESYVTDADSGPDWLPITTGP